jgi:hypothetical protein
MRIVSMILAAAVAGPAHAQVQNLPPEQKKEFNEIAFSFVIADECNKRHDQPELFRKATDAFRKVAVKYDMPDAEASVDKAAKDIQEKPLESTSGFTMATKEACSKLDRELTDYLLKP